MSAVTDVMAELALLEDPKLRVANEDRGDDHGVNLSALRAVAKRLKTQHELAKELWATGDTAARLLATLVARPKAFFADELDTMIHDIRAPKLLDWFITNIVKPGKHAEALRLRWKDDTDLVGRAGWEPDDRPRGQECRRAGPGRPAGPDRAGDEGGACTQAVVDEPLPCRNRHPPPLLPRPRDRHRRNAPGPHRLSGIAGLYAALRSRLDCRDGASPGGVGLDE
ncbi:MAG: DNA alkylation repair protein [Inquilinus sp.]|uniref:DNA alkylation repair protein n=1 Tax=Inquilinus sp. TaxID=1932117 RepID=UPI003F3D8657